MSLALGMDEPLYSHFYQGWYDVYKQNTPYNETSFQKWTRDMWWRLGAGDTVGFALVITIGDQPGSSDPNAAVNSFRFKGQGNIDQIQLVGN
jgi:hypothetical protein